MTTEFMGRFDALNKGGFPTPAGCFIQLKMKLGNSLDDLVKKIPGLTKPNVTYDWESMLQDPQDAINVLTIGCDFVMPIFLAWGDLYDWDKRLLPQVQALKEVKFVHDPKRPGDETGPEFALDKDAGVLTVTWQMKRWVLGREETMYEYLGLLLPEDMGHGMTGEQMRRVIDKYTGNGRRRVAASIGLFREMSREVYRCQTRFWNEGKYGPQPQFTVDWESLLADNNQKIEDLIDIITRFQVAPIDNAFMTITTMIESHYPKMKGHIKEIHLIHNLTTGSGKVDYNPDEGRVTISYHITYFGIPQDFLPNDMKVLFGRYFK